MQPVRGNRVDLAARRLPLCLPLWPHRGSRTPPSPPARDPRGAAGPGQGLLLAWLVPVTDRRTRLVELGTFKVFHNLNDFVIDSIISGSAMDTLHIGIEVFGQPKRGI